MKKSIAEFLKIFLVFSIILFGLQQTGFYLWVEASLFYPIWAIYLFHILATVIIYSLLAWVSRNFSDKTGYAFMGLSMMKMLAAVIFLLPLILSQNEAVLINILAFFIPYFAFLLFETLYVIKLINSK